MAPKHLKPDKTIELNGKLPPCYRIADYLWGKDCNIDSDGNSKYADSSDWNELTIILRSDPSQRVGIDPIQGYSNKLLLSGSSKELVNSVVNCLREYGSIA